MGSHAEAGRQLETWAKEAGLGTDSDKLITSTSPTWWPFSMVCAPRRS